MVPGFPHGASGRAPARALVGPVEPQDFEWSFLDGPCAWEPVPNSTQMNLAERRAVEGKQLGRGRGTLVMSRCDG